MLKEILFKRRKQSGKKRILLITESLGPGGAERQICGLAVLLKNRGYQCRLITYVKNQYYEPYLERHGVDYAFVSNLRKKSTRIFRLAKYINEFKPDTVISYLSSVNMALCLARPFIKSELIVSERSNRQTVSPYDRLLFNVYRLADYIVANSKTQAEYIKRNFPFLESKTTSIINFVDLERFTPSENASIENVFDVVTVARYIPSKNIFKYLQVVRTMKEMGLNVRFRWYGDKHSDKEFYSMVEKEYHRLGVEDYLELNDVCENVENVYRTSNLLMLPSLLEGYPNVIVEAMACGLPIICSNRYENPYIVVDGQNGYLFDPENVDDMVAAVCKVMNMNAADYNAMALRNRDCVATRNSEGEFIESYLKLIENK